MPDVITWRAHNVGAQADVVEVSFNDDPDEDARPGAPDVSVNLAEDSIFVDELIEHKEVQQGATCEGAAFEELGGFNHMDDVVWASDAQAAAMEDAVSSRLHEYAEVHEIIKQQCASAAKDAGAYGADDPIMEELNLDAQTARKKRKQESSQLACAPLLQQVCERMTASPDQHRFTCWCGMTCWV